MLQSSGLGIISLILLIIPEIYFSSSLVTNDKNRILNTNLHIEEISIFRENCDNNSVRYNYDSSFFKKFKMIMKEKVFIFSTLALSNLFFIITAVQYWAPDYLADVLLIKNSENIAYSFILVCITSPTLGVICGGLLSAKFGGYESRHSILICLILGILAASCSIPVTIVNDILPFTLYLWLLLFFGGAIVPIITGIIISSLPMNLRGSANSITSILCTLLGYMPAPYVYGRIYETTKYSYDRFAFMCVMYYSLFGVFLLALSSYFRYSNFNKSEKFISNVEVKVRDSTYTESFAKVFGSCIHVDSESFYDTEVNSSEKYEYSVYKGNIDDISITNTQSKNEFNDIKCYFNSDTDF